MLQNVGSCTMSLATHHMRCLGDHRLGSALAPLPMPARSQLSNGPHTADPESLIQKRPCKFRILEYASANLGNLDFPFRFLRRPWLVLWVHNARF